MLESVLSPNKSAANQVLGAISSPQSAGLENPKQHEVLPEYSSNPEDEVDKENAPTMSYEKDEKFEGKTDEFEEEPAVSESPPKRGVEEVVEELPESCHKKARTEENKDGDDIEVESSMEVSVSPPKTSASSKSIDDLLADLAKAKTALQQSKQTISQIKEQQQKMVLAGTSMASRVQAFDEELTKLKEKHQENGKDLEKVLSIRESTMASFKAAEETLQKITGTKSSDQEANPTEDDAGAKEKESVDAGDTGVSDSVDVDEDKSGEMVVTNTEEEECLVEEPEDKQEDTSILEDESEVFPTEAESKQQEITLAEDEETLDEPEKVAEETIQVSSEAGEPEEAASVPTITDSFESTPFDETKSEEVKPNLDFLDEQDVETDSESEVDSKADAERSANATATIDDTLALELQNTDENDSDDDSLISIE